MNILIRADSSAHIGTGHIMRDLVLVNQYKDANIIFATQELIGNINHKILEANHKLEILKSNNIKELSRLIKKYYINMIIIDHYDIDIKYEQQLKIQNPDIKIMVLDDIYLKHQCDILLNHNIYADYRKYKNLVPKDCELRCGSKYTLLRDEFIKEGYSKCIHNKKVKNIFLAMGGSDHSNINIKVLKVLKEFKNIKVNLVTTSANQNLDKLQKYVKNKKWIKLNINSNKIAQLMKKSDFAIVTPSVTLNEINYLKIPFIAIQTASNQEFMYKYLKNKKKLVLKKFKKHKLYKYTKDQLLNKHPNISTLYIITGTTRGLGKSFYKLLYKNNIIITINRNEINYNDHNKNICIDLSKINLNDLNKFEKTLSKNLNKNIKKVIFINNAFTLGTLTKIDKLKNDDIHKSISVNLVSSILLIKSFINKLKESNIQKKILNISSGAANNPIDGWSIYCTTKSAMEMFVNNVNLEYPNFKCFNIDPGVMNTHMQSEIRNFKDGNSNRYFVDLYNKNELNDTIIVAKNIIKEYA